MIAFAHRTAIIESLPKGSVGAEIGVLAAFFSRIIVDTVDPSLLYLVDCWEQQLGHRTKQKRHDQWKRKAMLRMAPEIETGVVQVLALYSTEAAKLIPDESMDWVYIDADHSYRGCLADLKAYYPKLKHGGVIAGHDYDQTGKDPLVGVCDAVRDFMEQKGLTDLKLTSGVNEVTPSFYLEKA